MDSDQQALLTRAAQHRRAGELAQAKALCRQIVQADPSQTEGWTLLGVLAFEAGNPGAALEHFGRAVAAAPAVAAYRGNRGIVLQVLGRHQEAEAEFRAASTLNPNDAGALVSLGNVLIEQNRQAEAETSYRRASSCGRTSSRCITISEPCCGDLTGCPRPRLAIGACWS